VQDNFIQDCASGSANKDKIELSSMMCNFIVRGPQGVVYTFRANCTESNDWNNDKAWTNFKSNYPIISSFIEQNKN
jgi:hypothetical protein